MCVGVPHHRRYWRGVSCLTPLLCRCTLQKTITSLEATLEGLRSGLPQLQEAVRAAEKQRTVQAAAMSRESDELRSKETALSGLLSALEDVVARLRKASTSDPRAQLNEAVEREKECVGVQ